MKIGIIRETKTPADNRVAFTPGQLRELKERYPEHSFAVQSSDLRAYSDDEYRQCGVEVTESVADCDVLFGIKEARIPTLIEGKHYFFFGHVAKFQEYNRPLLKAFLNKGLTFSDYEYLVDDKGARVAAFGYYAGVVGAYYTLRGWGMRTGAYSLPAPHIRLTQEEIIANLRGAALGDIKILCTGNGRVSHGAQDLLDAIGARRLSIAEFLAEENPKGVVYTVADADELVSHNGGRSFSLEHFMAHPDEYKPAFDRFAKATDILICGHFWEHDQPVYLSEESFRMPGFRIRMIGDITCDIMGSVKSTLRSSTHDDPFYDYNPATAAEEKAFSSDSNITVMAVDTCPNALPRETSRFFGSRLMESVMPGLLAGETEAAEVIGRSTIVKDGHLTGRFSYLEEYAAKD